jgi:hypothetical protein
MQHSIPSRLERVGGKGGSEGEPCRQEVLVSWEREHEVSKVFQETSVVRKVQHRCQDTIPFFANGTIPTVATAGARALT